MKRNSNLNKREYFCPVCRKKREFILLCRVHSEREQFNKLPLFYMRCTICDFVILLPEISKKDLRSVYTEEYFKELAQPVKSKILNKIITIQLSPSYKHYVQKFCKSGTLLDIGCGNGEFLFEMSKGKFKTFGVDPHNYKMFKNTKLTVKRGTSDNVPYEKNIFDIVTMWHVLEHAEDIHKTFQEVYRVLKKKKYFIIEVPNAKSLSLRLFGNNYSWLMVPEHNLYFSKKNLVLLFEKYGFKIQAINYPMKANLNFALSVRNFLDGKNLLLKNIIFVLSLPVSLIISFFSQFTGTGEVIRVVAKKI